MVSVVYAYQENRAGRQVGVARTSVRAQEAACAKHQATAGATEADGVDQPPQSPTINQVSGSLRKVVPDMARVCPPKRGGACRIWRNDPDLVKSRALVVF
jgi:hypothetical protein